MILSDVILAVGCVFEPRKEINIFFSFNIEIKKLIYGPNGSDSTINCSSKSATGIQVFSANTLTRGN